MGRRPSELNIDKIAAEAGVAKSTVSRVLNNKPNISEATRFKVMEIVKERGFSMNPYSVKQRKIALLTGSLAFQHYLSEVFESIYKYAAAHSFDTTLILQRSDSLKTSLEQVRDQQ